MSEIDILEADADDFLKEALDQKAKVRNRGKCVFPANHPKVTDNKDHYPINNEGQAHSALSYASKHKTVPTWFSGSLKELVGAIARHVHKEFPGIHETSASKNPGKG